jgi:hypothetical protein
MMQQHTLEQTIMIQPPNLSSSFRYSPFPMIVSGIYGVFGLRVLYYQTKAFRRPMARGGASIRRRRRTAVWGDFLSLIPHSFLCWSCFPSKLLHAHSSLGLPIQFQREQWDGVAGFLAGRKWTEANELMVAVYGTAHISEFLFVVKLCHRAVLYIAN